jgi:hypothetical protein
VKLPSLQLHHFLVPIESCDKYCFNIGSSTQQSQEQYALQFSEYHQINFLDLPLPTHKSDADRSDRRIIPKKKKNAQALFLIR